MNDSLTSILEINKVVEDQIKSSLKLERIFASVLALSLISLISLIILKGPNLYTIISIVLLLIAFSQNLRSLSVSKYMANDIKKMNISIKKIIDSENKSNEEKELHD